MEIADFSIGVNLVKTSGAFSGSMSFSSVSRDLPPLHFLVSESAFSPCSSHSQTRESAAKRSGNHCQLSSCYHSKFHRCHPVSWSFFSSRSFCHHHGVCCLLCVASFHYFHHLLWSLFSSRPNCPTQRLSEDVLLGQCSRNASVMTTLRSNYLGPVFVVVAYSHRVIIYINKHGVGEILV